MVICGIVVTVLDPSTESLTNWVILEKTVKLQTLTFPLRKMGVIIPKQRLLRILNEVITPEGNLTDRYYTNRRDNYLV